MSSQKSTVFEAKLAELQQELEFRLGLVRHSEYAAALAARFGAADVYANLLGDTLAPARSRSGQPPRLAAALTPRPARLTNRLGVLEEAHGSIADAVQYATGQSEQLIRVFQGTSDQLVLLATLLEKDPLKTRFFASTFMPVMAALDTQTTTGGVEFVPRGLSAAFVERVGVTSVLAELFDVVSMPSNPHDLPAFAVTPGVGFLHAEQTADTGQTGIPRMTPGTRRVTLTAVKLTAMALASRELEEDVLVALLPAIERELATWLAASVETALVNGDAASTHMDADVTTADDSRKSWDGLRKLCPAAAKTDGGNTVLTAAMLRTNRKKLGRSGVLPSEVVHIVSLSGAGDLSSDTAFITAERYGAHVTPLAGEIGRVDNVPVLCSESVRENLNASGVKGGATVNRTIALTVNRREFVLGQRRGVSVQRLEERFHEHDQAAAVVSIRLVLASRLPPGEAAVALTYNLAT